MSDGKWGLDFSPAVNPPPFAATIVIGDPVEKRSFLLPPSQPSHLLRLIPSSVHVASLDERLAHLLHPLHEFQHPVPHQPVLLRVRDVPLVLLLGGLVKVNTRR